MVDPTGLAPGAPYQSMVAAGIAAVRDINPTSIKDNVEYAGRVYKNWTGDTYSYTEPNKGTTNSSFGGVCVLLDCVAGYHTHAAYDPKYNNENFSTADKNIATFFGQPEFLGTPSGTVKMFVPSNAPDNHSVDSYSVTLSNGYKKEESGDFSTLSNTGTESAIGTQSMVSSESSVSSTSYSGSGSVSPRSK